MTDLCPDDALAQLTKILQSSADNGAEINRLIVMYPDDARLHFLKGSVLIEQKRPMEAHASLARAVELAPEFHLARYQLGFFELTSGEADKALATWGPLLRLPESTFLRQFVEGLTALIRDEFGAAINHLNRGMVLNQENEPLNNDILLLVREAEKLQLADEDRAPEESEADELSPTSLLLGQAQRPTTRH